MNYEITSYMLSKTKQQDYATVLTNTGNIVSQSIITYLKNQCFIHTDIYNRMNKAW